MASGTAAAGAAPSAGICPEPSRARLPAPSRAHTTAADIAEPSAMTAAEPSEASLPLPASTSGSAPHISSPGATHEGVRHTRPLTMPHKVLAASAPSGRGGPAQGPSNMHSLVAPSGLSAWCMHGEPRKPLTPSVPLKGAFSVGTALTRRGVGPMPGAPVEHPREGKRRMRLLSACALSGGVASESNTPAANKPRTAHASAPTFVR